MFRSDITEDAHEETTCTPELNRLNNVQCCLTGLNDRVSSSFDRRYTFMNCLAIGPVALYPIEKGSKPTTGSEREWP